MNPLWLSLIIPGTVVATLACCLLLMYYATRDE